MFDPGLSTYEIIEILRKEGYVVLKADRVKQFNAQHMISGQVREFAKVQYDDVLRYTKNDAAMTIGKAMLDEGAIVVEREVNDYLMAECVKLHARVIMPRRGEL